MLSSPKIIIRNRFQSFLKHKHQLRRKSHRFAKSPKTDLRVQDRELLDKSNLIEIPTMSSLPPQWVDQYQECSAMIAEITTLKKEIFVLNTRRLNTLKERQEAEIDREIYDKVAEATSKIRSCQALLKVIDSSKKETSQDERLCNNMCRALVVQLQEKARDLRSQQRNYLDRRKKLQGAVKVSFLELAADKRLAEDYEEQMLEEEEVELNLDARNKEIQKLVESIHGLHQVYKELSNMVTAQGTILDRIDYNIDQTVQNVSKAKSNLKKAVEHQKSPFACRCILSLIVVIVGLLIVMLVKYTR